MEQSGDMGDFFDFAGAASMPELSNTTLAMDAETQALVDSIMAPHDGISNFCPLHPHDEGCSCRVMFSDVTNTGLNNLDLLDPTTGFPYSDFASWINNYTKPEKPCDYCKSKGLDCFQQGQVACSACNALFRTCSFVAEQAQEGNMLNKSIAIDTLHLVPEDVCQEQGAPTGLKALRSFAGRHIDEGERATRRFPRSAVLILKSWLHEHSEHPYPTEEEKNALKEATGLKSSQIANWLANARRRGKVAARRAQSPSLRPLSQTPPMPIPTRRGISGTNADGKTWDEMNPLDRWMESPPEHEPALIPDIANAVKNAPVPSTSSSSGSRANSSRRHASSGGSDSLSLIKAPSITSQETGQSQLSSGSMSSAWSHGSSRVSFGSMGSAAKKDRRRRRKNAPKVSPLDGGKDFSLRVFQCTFCTDTFKSKYDWTRHEKTLHLSLEKWICAPLGDVITDPITGARKCVFCDQLNPSPDHMHAHNYRCCELKGLEARTFYRKDHLRQHLRLMHNDCKLIPSMDTWKSELDNINCRCGFCGTEFTSWSARNDHLSKEFRNGKKMREWSGCRGFDPWIAQHVQNAMPPYLIAVEAKSPIPFSASNVSSMAHHMHIMPFQADLEAILPKSYEYSSPSSHEAGADSLAEQVAQQAAQMSTMTHDCTQSAHKVHVNPEYYKRVSTCWEILTLRLGNFVRQQKQQGVTDIPDTVLQRQARLILYEDDDPWNSTAAENPEWLDLFKKAHGLGGKQAERIDRATMLEDLHVDVGDMDFDNTFSMDSGWQQNSMEPSEEEIGFLLSNGIMTTAGETPTIYARTTSGMPVLMEQPCMADGMMVPGCSANLARMTL